MKKIIVCGLMLAVLLCSLFVGCTTDKEYDLSAKVSADIISAERIDARATVHTIRNSAFTLTYKDVFSANDLQAQLDKVLMPTDEQSVRNELIKAEVLRQYASNEGSIISLETAEEQAKNEFALLKTDPAQADFYNNLKIAMQAAEIDETTFLALSCQLAYDTYNVTSAKSVFANSKEYSKDSSKSLDEQFEEFTAKLIKKAIIEQ